LASVNCGIPASRGRPVGDPIVVVVVEVVVVVVVVDVDVVAVEVVAAVVVTEMEVSGAASGDEEHPAATRTDTVSKPTRIRDIGQS
jgi:hypothetical protein